MSHGFTAEEVASLRKAFNKIDKNGDGHITPHELKSILSEFGKDITEARAKEIIDRCDPSGSGKITFDRFLEGAAVALVAIKAVILVVAAFKAADIDNNGYVTAVELKKLAKECQVDVPAHKIDELVHLCDTNKDGKISFKEFVQALIAFVRANQ